MEIRGGVHNGLWEPTRAIPTPWGYHSSLLILSQHNYCSSALPNFASHHIRPSSVLFYGISFLGAAGGPETTHIESLQIWRTKDWISLTAQNHSVVGSRCSQPPRWALPGSLSPCLPQLLETAGMPFVATSLQT